jgi:exopolysaccharide production protein ExoZ
MKLTNVQALRACAALMIVVFHCGEETARLAAVAGGEKLFDVQAWWEGVPIFFAISGFIMMTTTADTPRSLFAAIDFMRRRIVRIVPLYWLVTTVALATLLVAPNLLAKAPGDYRYIIASYLFWPYMRLDGNIRPLAAMGWTLNLEMLFYVVFAVSLLFRRGIGLLFLFASLGLLVTLRVSGFLPGVALNFWGDPVVLGFLSGAAVGTAFNNGWRLSGSSAMILAIIGFGIIFLCQMPDASQSDLSRGLAEAAPAALILIAFALGPQIDEMRRLWQGPLIVGDTSYSLYLVNPFLLEGLFVLWLRSPLAKLSLWMFIPIALVLAVSGALISYRLFERPVTRWLSNKKAREPALVIGRPRSFEPA